MSPSVKSFAAAAVAVALVALIAIQSSVFSSLRRNTGHRKLSIDPRSVVQKKSQTTRKIFLGENTANDEIPRVLHIMLLGDDIPPSFLKMAEWSSEKAKIDGFEVKVWRDADAEELIAKVGNSELTQIWEWFKVYDDHTQVGARLADLLRTLVMFMYGGVHLDADVIPCQGLEHMVDKPGVVSFPAQNDAGFEVNAAMVSAPARHRLFGLALESFIAKGEAMKKLGNLEAAGPAAFAQATDAYFKEVGISIPLISESNSVYNLKASNGIELSLDELFMVQVADVRFTYRFNDMGLRHLNYGSWFKTKRKRRCDQQPDEIPNFLDEYCQDSNIDKLKKFCPEGYEVME